MDLQSFLEVEDTYDVGLDAGVPDLVGVAGIAAVVAGGPMVLTSTYVDSADLALASAGVTLRRRVGGTDDGWHLKVPVESGGKLEVHEAVGEGTTPPARLRDAVAGLVGERHLDVVAELVTDRAVSRLLTLDGTVLAELCDDTVAATTSATAEPQSWRELEVELVDGDKTLLAAIRRHFADHGVAPAAQASKLGRVLAVPAQTDPERVRGKSELGSVLAERAVPATRSIRAGDVLLRAGRTDAIAGMAAALSRLSASRVVHRLAHGESPQTRSAKGALHALGDVIAALARHEVAVASLLDRLSNLSGDVTDRELAAVRRMAEELRAATWADVIDQLTSPSVVASLAELDGLVEAFRDAAPVRMRGVHGELRYRALRRAERRIARVVAAPPGAPRSVAADSAARAVEIATLVAEIAPGSAGRSLARADHQVLAEAAARLADLRRAADVQDVVMSLAERRSAPRFALGRLHGAQEATYAVTLPELDTCRATLRRLRRS